MCPRKKSKTPEEIDREYFSCADHNSPHFGQFCLCAGCRPLNHCIPDTGGCTECDGPVTDCSWTDEDERELYADDEETQEEEIV